MISSFEKLAIREICARSSPALLPKLDQLVVVSREFTEAGIYTRFAPLRIGDSGEYSNAMHFPGSYIFDQRGEPNSVVVLWSDPVRGHLMEVTPIDGERLVPSLEGCTLDFGDGSVVDLSGLSFGYEICPPGK